MAHETSTDYDERTLQTLGCYNRNTRQWEWARPKETRARCKKLEGPDPAWELEECFCCCGGECGTTAVDFSQGTEGNGPAGVRIAFATGGLTVSPDQPLMLADGSLIRAAELNAGSPDGHLIQANGFVLGDFTLQLHYTELAPFPARA